VFIVPCLWLSAIVARASSPEVSQPVPGSPVFVAFTASFDNQGTTQFSVTATSPDGSPLSYVWSLQNAACGSLSQPDGRTSSNGYYHGQTAAFPQGCPFAVETLTRVTVLVAHTTDLDATGTPRDGASYFTYSQVARAHDSTQTASIDPAPALHYFGVAAVASPTATPATTSSPSSSAPPVNNVTPKGSSFPLTGVIIGVVAVGAAGGLIWYVLRRRDDGQVDLVHPGLDLVHPYVDVPPAGGPTLVEPPVLPPRETFPPEPVVPTTVPHTPEDTGTQQGDPSGTAPEDDRADDGGVGPPPPLIFGPRLIDLPLGEPPATPADTPVEQPKLPPGEVFTPPTPVTPPPTVPATPATPTTPTTPPVTPPVTPPTTPPVTPPMTPPVPPVSVTPPPRPPKHCAPQVDDIFCAAMNRVLSRLRTLFGTEPAMADGMVFLARNGGELDFWVLNPITTCPGPHCPATMTLCGRCYPPHLLSDIMYGFVGGYFDLDTMIAVGGIAYQLEKWAAAKLYGDKPKQVVSPQHVTEAQPAYQVGVRLGKACRDPQHAGKWRLSNADICAELRAMNVQTALLKLLLKDPSQTGCPPATCVNTAADTDWSRKPGSWPTPIDETQRWAVTGKF
jgi:hypothetical protein